MNQRGFAFMAEAAFASVLLLFAASFLPLFSHEPQSEHLVAACQDAAIVFSKSGAFLGEQQLKQSVEGMSRLSGACIEASSGNLRAGSCSGKGERVAVSFPVWSGGVSSAKVACSRS